MPKKILSLMLVVLMLNLFGGTIICGQTKTANDAEKTAKIKKKIAALGTGEKARVRIETFDRTKLKGYIGAVDEETVSVTDKDTGAVTKADFRQIKSVRRGDGLTTTTKVLFAVGIAVPVVILLSLVKKRCDNEGGCF